MWTYAESGIVPRGARDVNPPSQLAICHAGDPSKVGAAGRGAAMIMAPLATGPAAAADPGVAA